LRISKKVILYSKYYFFGGKDMQDIQNLIITFVNLFLQYVWIANLFFIIVIITVEKKNPLYTILWIFILTLLPYVGFFIYLFFGLTFKKKRVANKIYKIKKLRSRKDVTNSDKKELRRWKGLITYLEMSTDNYITSNNDIQVYFDKDIVSEDIMTFHPNTNEKTIFISTQDLFKFLQDLGYSYQVLDL